MRVWTKSYPDLRCCDDSYYRVNSYTHLALRWTLNEVSNYLVLALKTARSKYVYVITEQNIYAEFTTCYGSKPENPISVMLVKVFEIWKDEIYWPQTKWLASGHNGTIAFEPNRFLVLSQLNTDGVSVFFSPSVVKFPLSITTSNDFLSCKSPAVAQRLLYKLHWYGINKDASWSQMAIGSSSVEEKRPKSEIRISKLGLHFIGTKNSGIFFKKIKGFFFW